MIDEIAILRVLNAADGPVRFADLLAMLGLNRPEHDRVLDRALHRLRREGTIRYQRLSPGSGFPKGGWVVCRRPK